MAGGMGPMYVIFIVFLKYTQLVFTSIHFMYYESTKYDN